MFLNSTRRSLQCCWTQHMWGSS